ncbi:nicotinic acid mononucleotide adenyltransferase [Arenibacter sp. 6A1]|uniref:toxin-antitoxin system YwqK family antitoxin n=1 Tax=Arenibacter sp. 6A1 TaxID=2720391 RepID=UPI00144779A9|nr:nicotinic acid mononucleotide adenyltransferase [Arenibacter sp. 6A1]NKI26677.1 nicotinic acid mononucleotide adenyltransferase [Arenibacter sp. 6A1]
MKAITLIFAFIFSIAINAQEVKPVFEKEGKLVKATYFHENGQIAQVGHFLNSKLHGEWNMYNEKGEKLAAGKYEKGTKTGKWFFWDQKVLREVDFNANAISSITEWDKNPVVYN